jgi:hypothetical protein
VLIVYVELPTDTENGQPSLPWASEVSTKVALSPCQESAHKDSGDDAIPLLPMSKYRDSFEGVAGQGRVGKEVDLKMAASPEFPGGRY